MSTILLIISSQAAKVIHSELQSLIMERLATGLAPKAAVTYFLSFVLAIAVKSFAISCFLLHKSCFL